MTVYHEGMKTIHGAGITVSEFSCQRGNLTIRGTEYRPEGELLPAAIVCHGFMANQESVRTYTKKLAELGYTAYCFDFCGGCAVGKSDGRTTDMTVFTEVEDLLSVIAFVKSLPYVSDRLLLAGCSQGGIVAALTAARIPDQVKKLVLFYPAFCIPDDARHGFNAQARFDPENIPDLLPCGNVILGGCYPKSVLHLDPYREIVAYKGPVLIIHGEMDDVVRLSYGVRAKESYGDRAVLHVISGAGHGFNGKDDVLAISLLTEFVK